MQNKYFAVFVGALGYFVDLFDIVLFNIYRVDSLKELGLSEEGVMTEGSKILNAQLIGLLLGGIFFGVMGDKFGRKAALFATIFTYSVTTALCGLVTDVNTYLLLRLICGIALAGELGAAVTLVTEQFSPKNRGWATTILTAFGISGVILAAIIGHFLYWRHAYFLGAALGFALLFLRLRVKESDTYLQFKHLEHRGDFIKFFSSKKRLGKFLIFIALGMSVWIISGVLASFSYEISAFIGLERIPVATALIFSNTGLILGDFFWGAASQILKSRKKAIFLSLLMTIILAVFYLINPPASKLGYLLMLTFIAIAATNWVVVITSCAEHFGTNYRALATTSLPNFIRGSAVVFIEIFKQASLADYNKFVVPMLCLIISSSVAILLLKLIPETFGKTMEFVEED